MYRQLQSFLTLVLCILLLTSKISASGLEEALEDHLKDTSHNEESESIKQGKEKGEKDHHIDSLVKDNHSNYYSKANDDTKYLKKEGETKTSSEKDAYGGYNTKQEKTEDNHSDGFKRGHKKGHHNQGFQNSYHKDESSNKSTFFDDLNDEGDQAGYNSRLNKYDNNGGRTYDGSHNNGQEYLRNNYQGGRSNKYGDIGNKHSNYQDYGKKYYLDNSENYNKYRNGQGSYEQAKVRDRHHHHAPPVYYNPGSDWQDWNSRRGWERPDWNRNQGWERGYGGPHQYDHGVQHDNAYDHGVQHDNAYGYPNQGHGYRYGESRPEPVAKIPANAPVVAQRKQTITIYEDPRYSGSEKGQVTRKHGDFIELDYQPSSRRYASYDDTYYSAPSGDRTAESSKINKLVYNYRRQ